MMATGIDDSFKKQGSVPFKWEVRPGVPKIQPLEHKQIPNPPPPLPPAHQPQKLKLRPPPAALEPHARTQSFRSTPRTRSESWRFEQSTRVRPECVAPGCFPSPFLRRKERSKRRVRVESESESERSYFSDFETLGRWSVSSRRSVSQLSLNASPASSSFSSYRSSPRPLDDADWAAFALF